MKASDIPTRISTPFGNSAGGGYIRNIPIPSQIGIQDGAASFTDGFPPLTMQPIASGGVPPFGQDMNGLLNQVTQWDRWQGAAGAVPYDATFSTEAGGYPQGAVLAAAVPGAFWYCTTDDNTSNPDAAGGGWIGFTPLSLYAADSGTADAGAVTLSPLYTTLAALTGMTIRVKKMSSPNTGPYTLNINTIGATTVTHGDGTALGGNELPANGVYTVVCDGTSLQLQSFGSGLFSRVFTTPDQTITGGGSLTIPHGLPARPTMFTGFLVCQSSNLNYDPGDTPIIPLSYMGDKNIEDLGVAVWPDNTNINVRYGSHTNPFFLPNKTTGNSTEIDHTKWKLRITACAF